MKLYCRHCAHNCEAQTGCCGATATRATNTGGASLATALGGLARETAGVYSADASLRGVVLKVEPGAPASGSRTTEEKHEVVAALGAPARTARPCARRRA